MWERQPVRSLEEVGETALSTVASGISGAFHRAFDTKSNRVRKFNQLAAQHKGSLDAAQHDPTAQKRMLRAQRPELEKAHAAINGPNRLSRAWSSIKGSSPAAQPSQPAAPAVTVRPRAIPNQGAPAAPTINAAPAANQETGTMFNRKPLSSKPKNPNWRQALKSMSKPKASSSFAKNFGDRVRAIKGKPSDAVKASAEKADISQTANKIAGNYGSEAAREKFRAAVKSGDANAAKGKAAFEKAGGTTAEVAAQKAAREAKLKKPTIAVKEFTPKTSTKKLNSTSGSRVDLPKPVTPPVPKRAPPKGGTVLGKPTGPAKPVDDFKYDDEPKPDPVTGGGVKPKQSVKDWVAGLKRQDYKK